MAFVSPPVVRKCVDRYHSRYDVKHFSCRDQFLCLVFAQPTYRENLLEILRRLRVAQPRFYYMGFHGPVAGHALAIANPDCAGLYRLYQALAFFVTHAEH